MQEGHLHSCSTLSRWETEDFREVLQTQHSVSVFLLGLGSGKEHCVLQTSMEQLNYHAASLLR